MVSRPVWEINPGDFAADTLDMTYGEVGAYVLLLMYYWRVGSLPDEDARLQRIARVDNFHWKTVRARLQPLFHDGWKHKRMEADLARLAEYRARQSANACGKRGRHSNAVMALPTTEPNPLKTNNPTPATAPTPLRKLKDNSYFVSGHTSDLAVDVDNSVSRKKNEQPTPANKFQKAWMDALASQLGPHEYAEAIEVLLADKELRDRATSQEIRERGSGVLAAAIAWSRWKKQQS